MAPVLTLLRRVTEAVGAAMMAAIFAIFIIQVAIRYSGRLEWLAEALDVLNERGAGVVSSNGRPEHSPEKRGPWEEVEGGEHFGGQHVLTASSAAAVLARVALPRDFVEKSPDR